MNNEDIPGIDKMGDLLSCMQIEIRRLQQDVTDKVAMENLLDTMFEFAGLAGRAKYIPFRLDS